MGFTCGIIGLPNVGKSTIFNALTSAKAASENFPFCTIEPNTGAVPIRDPRLDTLAKLASSKVTIPTQITFVDIAGLIRGASKGEGLGNQFLGHIRAVDAVAHVVRCFDDENIVHVDGEIDPIRDVDTIDTELALADLDSIQKQMQKLEKLARSNDKTAKAQLEYCKELEKHLDAGNPARSFELEQPDGAAEFFTPLLTSKPTLYVANLSEDDVSYTPSSSGDKVADRLFRLAEERSSQFVAISGGVEAEIAELPREERGDYLKELGIEESGLDRLAFAGYRLLDLITFFTIGPKEAHAWTAGRGSKAPQCAGKIHTDFEHGFIRAEVISYEDYVAAGSELGARDAGKMRLEGKDYETQDGDIVHFRFNN